MRHPVSSATCLASSTRSRAASFIPAAVSTRTNAPSYHPRNALMPAARHASTTAVMVAGFRAYQRIYISPIAESERAMGEAQLFAPDFHLREGGLCAGQISLNEPGERDIRVHPPDWVIGREPGSFDFG